MNFFGKAITKATLLFLLIGTTGIARESGNREPYDLYDRTLDGQDFNQFDFPETAEDGFPDEASGANSIKLLPKSYQNDRNYQDNGYYQDNRYYQDNESYQGNCENCPQ